LTVPIQCPVSLQKKRTDCQTQTVLEQWTYINVVVSTVEHNVVRVKGDKRPGSCEGHETEIEREEKFEQVVLAKVMSPVIVTVAPEAA
jgi:ribosomal protein RSM22 (predicted rRNA methylase)